MRCKRANTRCLGAGESRVRRRLAIFAVAGSLACLAAAAYRPAFYLGYLLMVLAALLLTPFLSLELGRLLRRPMKWLRPVEGSLAADSLIQAPRRTSATVAALMLSLALVIGQGGVARASIQTIEEWISNTLNPDLFVSTSEIAVRPRFPLSRQACFRNWRACRASTQVQRSAPSALHSATCRSWSSGSRWTKWRPAYTATSCPEIAIP